MAVGTGGDPHDEMRALSRIPLDPVAQLQDDDAILADQPLVPAQPVRDGDAGAEKSVGHRLAADHAVGIARADAAGHRQQLPGLPNGVFLGRGVSIDLNQALKPRSMGGHGRHEGSLQNRAAWKTFSQKDVNRLATSSTI